MTRVAPTSDLFVINKSVDVLSVREFPADVRDRLGGSDDDYVVSDRASRIGSQLIGPDAALLLRRFREPTRIVDAVFAHGTEYGLDPHSLLEEAYPFIRAMCLSTVLVRPDEQADAKRERLSKGDSLGTFVIVDVTHRVADTEILEARSEDGSVVAVKHVAAGASQDVRDNLRREASVLARANAAGARVAPRLIGADLERDDPLIWTEWIPGRTLFDLLRSGAPDLPGRAGIVRSLVGCYTELHTHGILHGDVHPNNMIVGADGDVRLIDFGGARLVDGERPGLRIGLVQFYEPEAAQAILAGQEPPAASMAGEQYSIAAVVFATLTGSYPIALSLVTERALGQIASTAPRSFEELGLRWPSVERVLGKALSKQPDERFPTLRDFNRELVEALATPWVAVTRPDPPRDPGVRPQNRQLMSAAQEMVMEYGLHSAALAGFSRGPKASIYGGAAGVALALLRVSLLSNSAASLAAAEIWIRQARSIVSDPLAFTDGSLGPTAATGELSLFQNSTGVHVVDALVNYALGDTLASRTAIRSFAATISGTRDALSKFPMDATNGAASLLLGSALLYPIAPEPEASQLALLGGKLAATVARQLDRERAENTYVGFAHGRAGSTYALLAWAEASAQPPEGAATRSLQTLGDLAATLRGSAWWPITTDDTSLASWTGWCHGTAGHLVLWTLASRVLGQDAYVDRALAAGRDLWRRRGSSGPSLCCGAAGEALALYELGRASGSTLWFDRGRRLASTAAASAASVRRNQGLFRSGLGVGLVAAESAEPLEAVWPVVMSPI